MKFNIDMLFDALTDYNPNIWSLSNEHNFFNDVRIFNKNQKENSDYIYIMDDKMFQHSSVNYPTNIILIGNHLQNRLESNDMNMLYLDTQLDILTCFSLIQTIIEDYDKWEQDLLMAIINKAPIKNLLEIAALKLTNPICLFDISSNMIEWAGPFQGNYEGTIWFEVLNKGFAPMEFYTNKELKELSQKMLSTNNPFQYHPYKDPEHRQLISPIIVNSKMVGSIGMTDINNPFTKGQEALVKHICELIEIAIKNSDTFFETIENSTYYIERLLNGFDIDKKIVSYYLERRNWNIQDKYVLLNFSYPVYTNIPFIYEKYKDRIIKCLPKSLICSYENSFAVILRSSDYQVRNKQFKELLNPLLLSCNMKCSISCEFYNFLDLKYYYIQSKLALSEGENKHKHERLFFYENYYCQYILHSLDSATSLKALCHPQILALWLSDNPSKKELVNSLYSYLLNGRNISETSKALYVHRNTLIYRLNKIEAYLELNFNKLNDDMLYYLITSCVIVKNSQF